MKIGLYDKLQALKRSEKYRKDYDEYLSKKTGDDALVGSLLDHSIKLSKAGRTLCDKYGLRFPINPDTPIDGDNFPIECFPEIDSLITYLDPPEKWHETLSTSVDNDNLYTHINGKLVLMVDTSRSYGELLEAFKLLLKRWGQESSSRVKTSSIDIWHVYDEVEKNHRNQLQVMRKLFDITRLPAYDGKADAYYKQVRKAYEKAKKIIEFVENKTRPTPRVFANEDVKDF
ncbi:MAG: hypothetical protein JXO48_02535 [Deltaproteobacteria bacterium]|nr:hypothetical protein [Deltaproteobacteria bacterium]